MTKTISSDDKEAIKARADEIYAEEAHAAADAGATMCKPVLDLLTIPAWIEVRAKLVEITPGFVTVRRLYAAVESLPRQMDLIGMFVPAEARQMPAAG